MREMAKHWETINIMEDMTDLFSMEVEVLQGFDFTQEELIEDYYEAICTGSKLDKFMKKHNLVYIGQGHFGEVFGLNDQLVIKLLHNCGEEMPDGYILSLLSDSDMTPNVYAYSDHLDQGFMIVDKVVGFNICDAMSSAPMTLEFDLDRQLDRIAKFFEECKRAEVMPADLHQANVMCDYSGNLMIVDVGCFEYGCFDPNSIETMWAYENAKWQMLSIAHQMDHVINKTPLKQIPDYIPQYLRWETETHGDFKSEVAKFLNEFKDHDKVGLPL
ncbi:serine/threonine kinase [Bacillus phage Riggi]|uniref:Serine/threonine kinase n=1 Tax=Bacillus phage Riggi TaxID=2884426 RepID=U5PZY2_9CAUD|nr:serine-threonine kinase [Bacillus phage Riggi]AGY48217.1 serine/threonine kinase [Bacillus phage Riggi]